MSYQVGSFCYATVIEAAGAACSLFVPQSKVLDDGSVITATCSDVNSSTGALNILVTTTNPAGISTTNTISQARSYPVCAESDYVLAFEIVFGALLALWSVYFAGKKVLEFLRYGRGDSV